jgi:hypothetical protein
MIVKESAATTALNARILNALIRMVLRLTQAENSLSRDLIGVL